jgi:hypothetical protein
MAAAIRKRKVTMALNSSNPASTFTKNYPKKTKTIPAFTNTIQLDVDAVWSLLSVEAKKKALAVVVGVL